VFPALARAQARLDMSPWTPAVAATCGCFLAGYRLLVQLSSPKRKVKSLFIGHEESLTA
jgi:hypothetical protein